jgi:uncharacterized CHY-type Zn-finger protein
MLLNVIYTCLVATVYTNVYACILCHDDEADHKETVWLKSEYDAKAIFCGNCKTEMTITEYLDCDNECPACKSKFNPKCSNHYHYYFEQ